MLYVCDDLNLHIHVTHMLKNNFSVFKTNLSSLEYTFKIESVKCNYYGTLLLCLQYRALSLCHLKKSAPLCH